MCHETDCSDISATCLVKGGERYIWVYRQSTVSDVLRSLGRMASNPELSLTWEDAATCATAIMTTGETSQA